MSQKVEKINGKTVVTLEDGYSNNDDGKYMVTITSGFYPVITFIVDAEYAGDALDIAAEWIADNTPGLFATDSFDEQYNAELEMLLSSGEYDEEEASNIAYEIASTDLIATSTGDFLDAEHTHISGPMSKNEIYRRLRNI